MHRVIARGAVRRGSFVSFDSSAALSKPYMTYAVVRRLEEAVDAGEVRQLAAGDLLLPLRRRQPGLRALAGESARVAWTQAPVRPG